MEKLMKPAEYAQELGISRQAVYAKIKRGILTAKNVEGKLYIVVDNNNAPEATSSEKETTVAEKRTTSTKTNTSTPATDNKDYKALLKAKDETISVLKGTVKDLKKSNKQITTTLKGEIDLLKEAFYEMRTLYVHQLEQKKSHEAKEHEEAIDVISDEVMAEEEGRWVGLKRSLSRIISLKKKNRQKLQNV